ncbi:MAG: hypothetical protein NTZ16_04520 [Verrucomicrobia bacterium]|nr:hypothetical protein [Verrucomicrobiota bacterium]
MSGGGKALRYKHSDRRLAMIIGYILLALVVIALIVAIYSGTGGRAWFRTREVPAKLIGQRPIIGWILQRHFY